MRPRSWRVSVCGACQGHGRWYGGRSEVYPTLYWFQCSVCKGLSWYPIDIRYKDPPMNTYRARQRESDGVWHWTRTNNEVIVPYTPCTAECKHKTRAEAERHHYEHEVATLEKRSWEEEEPCRVSECNCRTNVSFDPARSLSSLTFLCETHRTKEVWMKLHPFVPSRVIHSSV